MSTPLNVFSVMEPRMGFNESMVAGNYACVKGAETYTYRSYPSNSCDNNGINFSTPPPSFDDVLSRLAVLEVPLNLKFVGPGSTDTSLLMIQSNRDAFRAFPLESIIKNMTISINGENLTCNVNQVCHPFSRYHMGIDYLNNGITPNMLDTYASYSDGDGSNKNPLSWYADNSAQNARGAYADYDIITNTNTNAEISAYLRTYIMLSPFEWLSSANNVVPGLTQLTTLDWNINFASNLQRVWSRSDDHPVPVSNLTITIGSLNGTGNGNASLKLLWMTPRPEMRKFIKSLPEIKYPYFSTNRLTTSGNKYVDPNGTDVITSQVISLQNVPNAIYIYAIRDESTYVGNLQGNLTTTDTYFGIQNIDITFGNVTGILSTATPQQLYDISVRNLLKDTTFNEFVGYTNQFSQVSSTFVSRGKIGLSSAPIRLQPGEDFSLRDDLCPGVQEKVDMQVKVTVQNVNQYEAILPQLCILLVYEGYLSIYNGMARTKIGPLSMKDVENNKYVEIDWNSLQNNFGGAVGDRFKTLGRDVTKYAKKANKFLKDTKLISKGTKAASRLPTRFSNQLEDASNYAEKYGYGEGGMLVEEQRGLYGGKKMSNKQLKKRLSSRY